MFGYKGSDRNRYYECANTVCGHEICDHCLQWTRENVQATIEAENDKGDSSSDDLSSPSEQEFWDSEKSNSDAVDTD